MCGGHALVGARTADRVMRMAMSPHEDPVLETGPLTVQTQATLAGVAVMQAHDMNKIAGAM